jgi:hypothetical protein
MGYALRDVDVLEPFPAVQLRPDETGVGIVVRRGGRPIGFALQSLSAGSRLKPEDVDSLAGASSLEALVRESVLDELGRDLPPCPHRFTVVVCTRARAELLRRCLHSVQASVEASGLPPPEFVVVDNAPPDDSTARTVRELPEVRYEVEPRAGLDFARNHALATATGDVVAFLDDDVVVDAGWFAALHELWAAHPDAGGATGQVLPYELQSQAQVAFEQYGGFRRPWVGARYTLAGVPGNPLFPYGAGMFGAGCNMSYRREAVLDLGGFDEALDTGRPLPGGATSTCSPASCGEATRSSTPPPTWCTTSTGAPRGASAPALHLGHRPHGVCREDLAERPLSAAGARPAGGVAAPPARPGHRGRRSAAVTCPTG